MTQTAREARRKEVLDLVGTGVPRSYTELRRAAGSHRLIRELLDEGAVARLPLGMYGLPERDASWDSLASFAARYPNAVICLATAAAFHGLTTQNPHEIWAAFPYESSLPRKSDLACRGFRWRGRAMTAGVSEYDVGGVKVRMTTPERTVVDYLRTADRTGEKEAAFEALANYTGRLGDLLKAARELGAEKAVRPYVEAAAGLGRKR